MEHFVTPVAVVRQQETKPDRPQVEWAAQRTRDDLHCFGRLPLVAAAFAARATHLTYCP
jgi:hypothetical protein